MKPWMRPVLWGAFGIVVAAILSMGAFALAGDTIGGTAVPIPAPAIHHDPDAVSPTPDLTFAPPTGSGAPSSSGPTASPSDDHGGSSASPVVQDDGGHSTDDD